MSSCALKLVSNGLVPVLSLLRMLFGALPKSKETGKRRTVKRAFEVAHHGGYLYSSYSTGAGNPIGKPICRIRKSTENSDVWGITAEGKKHLGFNAKGERME